MKGYIIHTHPEYHSETHDNGIDKTFSLISWHFHSPPVNNNCFYPDVPVNRSGTPTRKTLSVINSQNKSSRNRKLVSISTAVCNLTAFFLKLFRFGLRFAIIAAFLHSCKHFFYFFTISSYWPIHFFIFICTCAIWQSLFSASSSFSFSSILYKYSNWNFRKIIPDFSWIFP